MDTMTLKADLHVHSKYSKRPSEWFLRKIGCAESYTDPITLYTIARKRGMDLVTITDHNTIAGSLEIAHLDNTFISEEITTYFPDTGCKLHILAYNITERQHDDITRFRENVYDLVAYFYDEGITHSLAHPLYAVNDRLTQDHFEQLLLLFKTFEINGTRDGLQGHILTDILEHLTPETLENLANKYDCEPYGVDPWKKHLTAGSDDHSSVNIASRYTEVDNAALLHEAASLHEFLLGLAQGHTRVGGHASHPGVMAHNLYSIAYQFYKTKFPLECYTNKEILLRFADRTLIPIHQENGTKVLERLRNFFSARVPGALFKSAPKTMQSVLLKEARNIIWNDAEMQAILGQTMPDPQTMSTTWYRFVNRISENILKQFADSILESLAGANLFDIFHTIGSVGSLYTLLSPYFVAYTVFTKDRPLSRQCHRQFVQGHLLAQPSVTGSQTSSPYATFNMAHFTDTFYEVNGVAKTLRKYSELAQKHHQPLTLITCGLENGNSPNIKNFAPIGTFEMPLYPEMKLLYPPMLEMLNYCYEQGFTHIHSATPGPMGLAALAIARILKLPIYGTYHTALPQYAHQLSDDNSLEDLVWRYVIWYYNQMDVVYVPSHATGQELIAKGIEAQKIQFYPRGTDTERFHPSKRNGFFKTRIPLTTDPLLLLYVGRVSREKNLPVLVNAFQQVAQERSDVHLVVVGDGPYLSDMKTALAGLPATFTGIMEGEDLTQAYASSDLFVFPSTTDTFGNVVLEAQASGIPVVVTDQGGPQENLIPDETGLIIPANNADMLSDAIVQLADDRDRLAQMKQQARQYMETRSLEAAYLQLWDSYQQ
jgi:glycosyltransferase involved in cell wall biosynthesis/predicted metal-dependent phosphoesterase TrpH